MKPTRQLFIMSESFIHSFTQEEVSATYQDMLTLNIATPPYPDFDILMPASCIMKPTDPSRMKASIDNWKLKLRYTSSLPDDWLMDKPHTSSYASLSGIPELDPHKLRTLQAGLELLIVALATRNITKATKPNKLASLHIGKSIYSSTTTLSVGPITEYQYDSASSHGHHASPRPHLRRGHIRHQRFGPSLQYTKEVFIPPTFVNVDQEFIDRRTAYNLKVPLPCPPSPSPKNGQPVLPTDNAAPAPPVASTSVSKS